MNPTYIIDFSYFIHSKKNGYSFFNYYPNNIIESTPILNKICILPKNIAEIYTTKEYVISDRLSGIFNNYQIKYINNINSVKNSKFKINIVFTETPNDFIDIKSIIISKQIKTDLNKLHINFNELTNDLFYKFIKKYITSIDMESKRIILDLIEIIRTEPNYRNTEFIDTDCFFYNSIYSKSNLILLKGIKVNYTYENSYFSHYDEENITQSINIINLIKNKIISNLAPSLYLPNIDYIVSDMSINTEFLANKNMFSQNALKNDGITDVALVLKAIKCGNQNDYKNSSVDNDHIKKLQEERIAIESMISIHSSNSISPNIKIPLCNSKIFNKLQIIGNIDRSNNQNKINKAIRELKNEFSNEIKDNFSYFNKKTASSIKLVSNLPIEWAEDNGLPLMVRHEVSRIPCSPGYVSSILLLENNNIILKTENFKKILIISSFKDNDPIKNDLKEKIKIIEESLSSYKEKIKQHAIKNKINLPINYENEDELLNIEIIWHNISNKEELINCINENKTAITIFDLHGNHNEDGGYISLKEENISVFDLIGKVQVSPIVILSSCDTNPIDKNHYTTANAFFLAGAKTVLASALPLLSKQASTFISRLLTRIQLYLPRRVDHYNKSIRWSSVITGLIRKSYYSELINLLIKKNLLTSENKYKLELEISHLLDPLTDNWSNEINKCICNYVPISNDTLNEIIKNEFNLPECLKYIQMGNPEQIIIASENEFSLL